jgi:hypothetical protein
MAGFGGSSSKESSFTTHSIDFNVFVNTVVDVEFSSRYLIRSRTSPAAPFKVYVLNICEYGGYTFV